MSQKVPDEKELLGILELAGDRPLELESVTNLSHTLLTHYL